MRKALSLVLGLVLLSSLALAVWTPVKNPETVMGWSCASMVENTYCPAGYDESHCFNEAGELVQVICTPHNSLSRPYDLVSLDVLLGWS